MKLARQLFPFRSRPDASRGGVDADQVAGARSPSAVLDHREAASAASMERLDALDRAVAKLGRQQFQATTLLEGQSEGLEDLARCWREHLAQRQREADDIRQALAALDRKVRLSVVKDLLPVADALAEGVRSAQELASEWKGKHAGGNPKAYRWRWPWQQAQPQACNPPAGALEAWLDGLRLVERRLLALLEREGVRPIAAVGLPFDPQRHLAVAVQQDGDTRGRRVIAEIRRGFVHGDRVLRHAEVVVAQGLGGDEPSTIGPVSEAE